MSDTWSRIWRSPLSWIVWIPVGLLFLGAMGAMAFSVFSLPWVIILVATGDNEALPILIMDVAILGFAGLLMLAGAVWTWWREDNSLAALMADREKTERKYQ